MNDETELERLLEMIQDWDPDSKKRALSAFRTRHEDPVQLWYCPNRLCDGKPHDNFPYRHARADQWPPPGSDWFLWLMMSGRGAGKTKSGSGWVRSITKYVGRIAGIGRRGTDFRDTMIEGDSGLIRACELAGESYDWKPALKEFRFQNGALLKGFSAEEPDSLRGPNNGAGWLDEPAHMDQIDDVWSNLLLTLRLPGLPGGAKVLCTTTPKPIPWIKQRIKDNRTRVTRVSTLANIENLDQGFYENVVVPLMGTREGRQELEGELLEDVEGALWTSSMLRYIEREEVPELDRVVVSIDPAGSHGKKSDETGIIGMGRRANLGYVLDDQSGRYSPSGWANRGIAMYEKLHADAIVVETNFGGEMVKENLRKAGFDGRIIEVRASRGKKVRAEPIVALYEQERIFHVKGLPVGKGKHGQPVSLEDEQLTWVPDQTDSPNRVDALVWGATELFKSSGPITLGNPLALNPTGPYDPLIGRNIA